MKTDSVVTTPFRFRAILFTCSCLWAADLVTPLAAQTEAEMLEAARSIIQAERQSAVADAMRFTPGEGDAFWPLYHRYRADMDPVGDGLKDLVLEYSRMYPDIPNDRARSMLKDILSLEKKQVATRARHLEKIGKVLPADKTLRFAQVESRLDLAVRLQMASHIPLVPIEGQLTGERTSAAAYLGGEPGGVRVETYELTATVAAIDRANRKLTLVSADGIKQTVKAGPEVINFDQVRVGDRLRLTATEELVVQLAGAGESLGSGAGGVVVLAPRGAKPGGVAAETTQVTATVAALDADRRTATLRFEDGTTRTFPVRGDVDLGRRKVGDRVVIRVTEMIALTVEKP